VTHTYTFIVVPFYTHYLSERISSSRRWPGAEDIYDQVGYRGWAKSTNKRGISVAHSKTSSNPSLTPSPRLHHTDYTCPACQLPHPYPIPKAEAGLSACPDLIMQGFLDAVMRVSMCVRIFRDAHHDRQGLSFFLTFIKTNNGWEQPEKVWRQEVLEGRERSSPPDGQTCWQAYKCARAKTCHTRFCSAVSSPKRARSW
jgi:hypothetical protein